MGTQIVAIDLKPIENKLQLLKQRAEEIQVINQETYTLACQIALDGRKEVKAIGFVLDPGIESARQHLDMLRNQKKSFVDRVTPIIELASGKAEFWKAEERRKAEAEQERINAQRRADAARKAEEERLEAERQAEAQRKQREAEAELARKQREKELEEQRRLGEINKREMEKQKKLAAEQAERERKQAEEDARIAKELAAKQAEETKANVQTVTVKPSVPTVAGIRQRVNYYAEVVNENTLLSAYIRSSATERVFLRRFICANEQEIGKYARETKDSKAVEAAIPGVHAWEKDAI